jgi:Protein of unknown function (DUF3223)
MPAGNRFGNYFLSFVRYQSILLIYYFCSMKYSINGISFKTDKELQEFAKGILYRGSVNSCLEGEDLEFMLDYFRSIHVEWSQKEGVGVAYIRRITDVVYGKYRAFQIERTDSSVTDISYILSNIKIKKLEKEFKEALRWIIEPQILDFKKESFAESQFLRCPISNDLLFFEECHADHFNPTFDEIVSNFIKLHGISDFSTVVAPGRDNQTRAELSDDIISQSFFDFHKSVANLRLLSPTANLTLKRK